MVKLCSAFFLDIFARCLSSTIHIVDAPYSENRKEPELALAVLVAWLCSFRIRMCNLSRYHHMYSCQDTHVPSVVHFSALHFCYFSNFK